jgi:predicted nucleic acid-binding protein
MTDVYLIDTSAWIEWLRATGSPADSQVEYLLHNHPDTVAITEPVTMEILSGAGSATELSKLEKLTSGLRTLPFDAARDFHEAAAMLRAMRSAGTPVRSATDCLIAAVAARTGATVLHRDRDFEQLAAAVIDLRARSLR